MGMTGKAFEERKSASERSAQVRIGVKCCFEPGEDLWGEFLGNGELSDTWRLEIGQGHLGLKVV
jgi:hypothetical protein